MIRTTTQSDSPVVEITVEGSVTNQDLEATIQALQAAFDRDGKTRVIEIIQHFTGIELAALGLMCGWACRWRGRSNGSRSSPTADRSARGPYGWAMSESDKPLRAQIDDAIAVVQRDLEILRSPSSIGGGADNRSVIADLEAELAGLKEARANVGPHDT
jgi:hypothetical protein